MGRKLGITLAALVCSVTIVVLLWPPKFGIDLLGGVILVYEVDEEATLDLLAADAENAEEEQGYSLSPEQQLRQGTAQLIEQLKKRINPSGVLEVVVRPYGENQVEVIVPQAESADLDSIKAVITKAGILEFMIVANRVDHDHLISRAEDESQEGVTYVTDRRTGRRIARWVRVDEKARGAFTGNNLLRGGGDRPVEVLMKVERANYRLSGKHLQQATQTTEKGGPAVSFMMNPEGAQRLGRLTQENISDNTISRQLAIVMDNVVISAPSINGRISGQGVITGSFTVKEVQVLTQVLRAGRLPVVLRKEPISEQKISATLGDDTIRKGQFAITISLIAVLIFMVIYYRVAGLVACFALLFNLVLILALMIAISADLTLPGIAGLVLTVGMAVDANVLIYERIREELNNGATLRVALANGFGKAMSTIVDANLTTLITAAVLYRIGTDQVRGFAVTLFVGIIMSMFTAIYVSRGIFDILERKRIIKTLHMLPSASSIGYDFIGKRKIAAIVSTVVILVGMAAVGVRGRDIFDIDFNGGTSVQVFLKEATPISVVRETLGNTLPDLSVSAVTLDGAEDRIYKVDTSLADYGELGIVKMTDRKGKSAEVDLTGAESLANLVERLSQADVGISVEINADRDGIEFQDTTGADSGTMSVESTGEAKSTAADLNMDFRTDQLRWDTGRIPEGVEVVQKRIQSIFTSESGESMLVMHDMNFTPPAAVETKKAASPVLDGFNPNLEPPTTDANSPAPEVSTGDSAPQPPSTSDPMPMSEPSETAEGNEPSTNEQSLWLPPTQPWVGLLPWNVPMNALLQAAPDPEADENQSQEEAADEPKAEEKEENPPAEPAADQPESQDPPTEPVEEQEDANQPIDGAANPVQTGNPAMPVNPLGGQQPGLNQPEASRFKTQSELTFDEKISADTVRNLITNAAIAQRIPEPEIALLDDDGTQLSSDSRVSRTTWQIKLSSDQQSTKQILERVSFKLDSTPVWPSSSKIGSKVAGDMQTMAVAAVIFCLVGIVGYIWFRFQSVAFGVAAVVALVHDVAVTLGFIALSTYLAPVFGFLQVTEFKISLPVVAAFLTIIGYSLNDTIVIFDRIREVRGKSPDITADMVNLSVNQTLGRTLLTSLTTLIVVLILYFMGGEGIHSFSFSLVIGVIAGTYSTVFIACPVLIWLMNRDKAAQEAAKAKRQSAALFGSVAFAFQRFVTRKVYLGGTSWCRFLFCPANWRLLSRTAALGDRVLSW